MTLDRDFEQPVNSGSPQWIFKLERQRQDLEAQLQYAKQEQARIKGRLQTRLFEQQRALEAKLDSALAKLKATQAERDQLQTRLTQTLIERTRLEQNYADRLAEAHRQRSKLENELKGVYASLSWRLTSPLRWFNARIRLK